MVKELDATPDAEKANTLAVAATQPDTFDFAAAIQGRSYPEIVVPVYLDEKKIKRLVDVDTERKSLELRIANTPTPTVEQATLLGDLDAEYQSIVDSLRSERYTVNIKGVPPEKSIQIEERAYEEYPREYEENTHPLTGALVRTEVPNPKRDEYFALLLRQAHLVSVVAPNGAVDRDFEDIEKVRAVWQRLPFIARAKVDQAINEATIVVDFYDALVDEVF